jgi:hypothetical protein
MAGVTRWWMGGDNAALTEPVSSHANCPKTRRLPPPWSPCSSEGRVHAVLGSLTFESVHLLSKTFFLLKLYHQHIVEDLSPVIVSPRTPEA